MTFLEERATVQLLEARKRLTQMVWLCALGWFLHLSEYPIVATLGFVGGWLAALIGGIACLSSLHEWATLRSESQPSRTQRIAVITGNVTSSLYALLWIAFFVACVFKTCGFHV